MNFKSKIGLAITILFCAFIISRFTTINIDIFRKSPASVPDLSQILEGKNLVLEKVSGDTWNEIRYDPVRDFFIVAQGDNYITKLNGSGKVTFRLEMDEREPGGMPDKMHYYEPSCFVISWSGIYDLSKEKPYLEKFEMISNSDGKMDKDQWIKTFQDLYNSSEVVFWDIKNH